MTTAHRMLRFVFFVIVGSFLLSGCGNINESLKTKAQAAGISAAFCAALAVGLTDCDDSDCDKKKKRIKNALIAAAFCGALGYAYGEHVASKKEKFASQEQYLDMVIAEAIRVSEEARQKNSNLATDIASLEHRIRQASAYQAETEQSQLELKALQKDAQQQRAAANTQLEILTREIQIQKAVLKNEKDSAPMNYEVRAVSAISGLDTQKRSLESYIAQLEAIDERVIR